MILRPQRYRTLMGFLLGLSISLIISGLIYYYYRSNAIRATEQEKMEIRNQAIEDYKLSNPTALVYIAATDKRAGEVLSDKDMVPAELTVAAVPTDAITNPQEAAGKVMRCDIKQNTVVTSSLIYEEGEYPDDLRLLEYTVVNLPRKLEPMEYVDIRIMFPNGLDYIVLSKKKVIDLMNMSETNQKNMLWFHAGEEEILRMASAIVDASMVEGAYLYAVPYIAPDIQDEAVRTYPANSEVQNLILQNPNIVSKAVTELEKRNRELFEEQVNKDYENSGKNRVYGENVPLPDSRETSSEETNQTTLDGRL